MKRPAVLFALGLLWPAQAEILSTIRTCDIPADVAPSAGISAGSDADLHRVALPRVTIEVKQDLPIQGRTFAEALLARVAVDPDGGSVVLDGEGNISMPSPALPCD
jgi:hypothetical protein